MATVTAATGAVDLLAASDTGASSTDNITNKDNSSGKTLQFDVVDTIAGADVVLYADGEAIGSGTGNGGTLTITTNGTVDLADGELGITAKQTLAGKLTSIDSSDLTVTVDTTSVSVDEMIVNNGSNIRSRIGWLDFQFNESDDVDWLIGQGLLTLQVYHWDNVADEWESTPIDISDAVYSWEGGDYNTGRWDLWFTNHINLADGYYAAIIAGADLAGNAVDLGYSVVFWKLTGDLNADRAVDVSDLSILAGNFRQTTDYPWDFLDGDCNLDAAVDVSDLSLLAENFRVSLVPFNPPTWP